MDHSVAPWLALSDHEVASHFEGALRRGLGRAVLMLQSGLVRPDRELILDACLHNWAYDRQCEPNRARYMFDVARATGEPEYYAERVCEHLTTGDAGENVSWWQLHDLALLFARAGDEESRRALYAAVSRDLDSGDTTGTEALIRADGLEAFVFIAERLIRRPLPEEERWEEDSILRELEEAIGAETAREALEQLAREREEFRSYVDRLRALREELAVQSQMKREPWVPPWDDVLRVVSGAAPERQRYTMRMAGS